MRKPFRELGKKMQRERSQKIVDSINSFIEEEDSSLTVNEFLGYMLYRHNYVKNKELANLGLELFNSTLKNKSFTLDEAIAIMHTLVLSKEQMRLMKSILSSKGVYFPNTTELNEARKKLRPVVSPILEGKGVAVDYKEVVIETGKSIIRVIKEGGKEIKDNGQYLLKLKDGCDGAGQQAIWKSKSMKNSKGNMFQYGITPLSLTENTNEIWRNKTPNSPETLRVVYMIREKESDEEMINYVISKTDTCRSEMCNEGFDVFVDGIYVHINVEIMDTMKDMKLKRSISGLGGAPCILCKTRVEDWSNPEYIKEGFSIDRNADDTIQLFQELVDENGQVPTRPNDFQERQGLTKKPITISSQKSICITHSYINVTGWMLKLLYRIEAEYFIWNEKKTVLGEPIRRAKYRVLEKIIEETGLKLDVVCDPGEKGGTSTDGNAGREFFTNKFVETLKVLVKEKYHFDLFNLHENLSTILRIVSCQQMVNIEMFRDLCEETNLLIAEKYPWAKINHTLHGLIHHSCELIELNGCCGLGALSEECLKAANKDIRRYLELYSRKTCPVSQLTDVMNRLLERSNPKVINEKRLMMCKKKKDINCLECNSNKHTTRQHDKLQREKSWYDVLVESILM